MKRISTKLTLIPDVPVGTGTGRRVGHQPGRSGARYVATHRQTREQFHFRRRAFRGGGGIPAPVGGAYPSLYPGG